MGNITIGEIGSFLGVIAAFVGSVEFILIRLKKWFKTALNSEIEPVREEVAKVREENQNNELQSCMNYLVIAIEKAKKDKFMSNAEKRRFYEVLDIYVNKYHKNSYIHKEVEDLEKLGIL